MSAKQKRFLSIISYVHTVTSSMRKKRFSKNSTPKLRVVKFYCERFDLSKISYSVAQATFGDLLCATLTTFEGKTFLHFPFSEPSIRQQTMQALLDRVVSCLVDIGSSIGVLTGHQTLQSGTILNRLRPP